MVTAYPIACFGTRTSRAIGGKTKYLLWVQLDRLFAIIRALNFKDKHQKTRDTIARMSAKEDMSRGENHDTQFGTLNLCTQAIGGANVLSAQVHNILGDGIMKHIFACILSVNMDTRLVTDTTATTRSSTNGWMWHTAESQAMPNTRSMHNLHYLRCGLWLAITKTPRGEVRLALRLAVTLNKNFTQ